MCFINMFNYLCLWFKDLNFFSTINCSSTVILHFTCHHSYSQVGYTGVFIFTDIRLAIITIEVFLQDNENFPTTRKLPEVGIELTVHGQYMGNISNVLSTELVWHVLARASLNSLLFMQHLTFWVSWELSPKYYLISSVGRALVLCPNLTGGNAVFVIITSEIL